VKVSLPAIEKANYTDKGVPYHANRTKEAANNQTTSCMMSL